MAVTLHQDTSHLEADTEGEGEGEDDQQHGDAREDPATQADASLLIIS